MSERYSKLFSLSENLYASGSPVVIAAGALLKDNQTGKVIAQLKLRNIGNKAIKAATVSIIPFDTVGNPLGEPIQYQYLDLNAQRDNDFGSKSAISLPDITTRSFAVSVTEIAFVDNSVWSTTESTWEPLSVPATISSLHGAEFAKQFCLEYGADCKNFPLSEKDLWHCTCGALNHKEESHCHSCRKAFAAISSYNVDELNAKKNKRLADEKTKAEYEAEQARIKAKKNAKKAKKLAIIAACAVAVLLLITKVIIPGLKYSKADKLVEAGQYTEAIKAYEAIDDSEKTKERIGAAYYTYGEELLAEEQFDKAVTQFKNAGEYKDAKDRIDAAYYAYAEDLLSSGNFDQAVSLFKSLGDYQDAKERVKATNYAYAEDLVSRGYFDQAVNEFMKLGDYQDAIQKADEVKGKISGLTIEFIGFTTSKDGPIQIDDSLPRSSDYLCYTYYVDGPNPQIGYTLRQRVQFPGEEPKLADWVTENVKAGEYRGSIWEAGYTALNSGTLVVEILIDKTGAVVGRFEIPIK